LASEVVVIGGRLRRGGRVDLVLIKIVDDLSNNDDIKLFLNQDDKDGVSP
jgi:hypothetical protein